MFVFAADDVSKKDLKKISKKIERQLAKWEENDQEKTEKRKRNDDGIGVKDDGADEEIRFVLEPISLKKHTQKKKKTHTHQYNTQFFQLLKMMRDTNVLCSSMS